VIDTDEWNRRAQARRDERVQRSDARQAGKALGHARKLARNRAHAEQLKIPGPEGLELLDST
jgi:hypothetical protein